MLSGKVILSFWLFISPIFCLVSQDLKADLELLYKAYDKSEQLSMDISVYQYDMAEINKRSLVGKAIMRKSGNQYYSKFLSDELINNNNESLVIDHESKTIQLGKSIPIDDLKTSFDVEAIGMLLKEVDSIEFVGVYNGQKHYQFYFPDGEISEMTLSFFTKSYFLGSLSYTYRNDNEYIDYGASKIEVIYDRVANTDNIDPKVFSVAKIIRKEVEGYITINDYKEYDLIINTQSDYEAFYK